MQPGMTMGVSPNIIFWLNLIFLVTYNGMQKLKLIGKPLLGEKYVEGKKKERKNNQSLVATTSALARTTLNEAFHCIFRFYTNFEIFGQQKQENYLLVNHKY